MTIPGSYDHGVNESRLVRLRQPYTLGLIVSATFWLLTWYGDTLASMVTTWRESETFAHGFLIVPICLWLIWGRRESIRALTPQPNFWYLIPLLLVTLVWILGNLGEVVVVQQYSMVFMLLLLVATIVGNAIVKELAFPLLFLLFAVPFGEILLPTLMEHTADFAVFALRLTGIPVYREGLYFSLPSGNWSVVEACSGLRYLIASLTLGCLYAYLTYRSLKRRLIFIALSIVVPILANWLRAYMIVMIGHLSSMKLAVGVDHIIYGWLFFGVVMLALFWTGSFWREDFDTPANASLPDGSIGPAQHAPWRMLVLATLAVSGVAASAPLLAAYLKSGIHVQPVLQTPAATRNWQALPGALSEWTPHYLNPTARLRQAYAQGGKPVELYIGYYRNQRQHAELIASQNVLVHSTNKVWGAIGSSRRQAEVNGSAISLIETTVRNAQARLLVWHWYWVDGQYTTNSYWAKFLEAKSQLFGRGDDSAVIVLSTEIGASAEESRARLNDFLGDMSSGVAQSLQSAR